jgi:hypothetical protein
MLDAYETEYEEMCKNQNKHAHELDQLRNANRALSSQVYVTVLPVSYRYRADHQTSTGSFARCYVRCRHSSRGIELTSRNQEHVDLVRQLVMSKIEKEETANELVRVKLQ